jgi:type II secretory pathway predicted ATPase ExeA
VEERELTVLTGEIGCGKTTLTRALIDSLGEKYRVILIINPRLTAAQFLRLVARRLEIEQAANFSFKDDLLESIYSKVYSDYEKGIRPVIIIDEAQNFEEIRLLTNFQLDDANLLSLVLVGQTDLKRRLTQKSYQALRQRIGMFYHLGPLSEDEMKGYIEHRLSVSGRTEPLFTDEAISALYRYSGGIPRVINSLATTALLEGCGAAPGVLIDLPLVDAAARELGFDGMRMN